MNKKSIIIVLGSLVALLILSCQEQAVAPPELEAELGIPFEISLDQVVTIEKENIVINFSDVLEDSRCPQGALCFWQGRLRVNMVANGQNLELSLGGDSTPAIKFKTYQITLQDVLSPIHIAGEENSSENYRVVLLIEKI